MSLSKKAKWAAIIILIVLFVYFSVYRYQQVNRPYKDYSVSEELVKLEHPFTVNNLTYIFGKPLITEEKQEIRYEIPLSIINKTSEIKNRPIVDFYIRSNLTNNMLDRELFLANSVNKKLNLEGVLPKSMEKLVLFFTMRKEWGIHHDTKADFYFLEYKGDKVIKHKLPLNSE